jgi:hypothetical protein
LRFFSSFEAQTLEWRFLCVADARLHLALPIWIVHAARKRDGAIMLQHVAVQRIERRIVQIGREHAFFQVVEHHHASRAA